MVPTFTVMPLRPMNVMVPFMKFGQSPLIMGTTGSPAAPVGAGMPMGGVLGVMAVPPGVTGGGVTAGMSLVGKGELPFAGGGVVAGGGSVLEAGGGVTAGLVGIAPLPATGGVDAGVVGVIAGDPAADAEVGPRVVAGAVPVPGRITVLVSEPHAPAARINPKNNALVRMLVRAIAILNLSRCSSLARDVREADGATPTIAHRCKRRTANPRFHSRLRTLAGLGDDENKSLL